MTACVDFPLVQAAIPFDMDEVRPALQRLLASPMFSKAPRMSNLLAFLVEKKISGQEQEINEYAIGLQVFRRDARCYDTLLDPVVRVQVGRLRDRLATYYAAAEAPHALRIAIPAGSYVPVFLTAPRALPSARPRTLELTPLRDLTGTQNGAMFVAGVDEELNSRLFRAFGHLIQLRERALTPAPVTAVAQQSPRRIEGSLRVDAHQVRACVRVVDSVSGRLEWVSQFDCHGELGIRLQEQVAVEICTRLQDNLGA